MRRAYAAGSAATVTPALDERRERTDGTRATTTEEEEDHDRDLAREQHDPEVGGPAEVEHREGERDGRHAGAERRDGDRRQVAGEAPLVEHLE